MAQKVCLASSSVLHDRRYSWAVISALGELGPEAGDAVPALLSLRDPDFRWLAIHTAGKIASEQAIRDLVSLVEHGDLADQRAAVEALGQVGPAAIPDPHTSARNKRANVACSEGTPTSGTLGCTGAPHARSIASAAVSLSR